MNQYKNCKTSELHFNGQIMLARKFYDGAIKLPDAIKAFQGCKNATGLGAFLATIYVAVGNAN